MADRLPLGWVLLAVMSCNFVKSSLVVDCWLALCFERLMGNITPEWEGSSESKGHITSSATMAA